MLTKNPKINLLTARISCFKCKGFVEGYPQSTPVHIALLYHNIIVWHHRKWCWEISYGLN